MNKMIKRICAMVLACGLGMATAGVHAAEPAGEYVLTSAGDSHPLFNPTGPYTEIVNDITLETTYDDVKENGRFSGTFVLTSNHADFLVDDPISGKMSGKIKGRDENIRVLLKIKFKGTMLVDGNSEKVMGKIKQTIQLDTLAGTYDSTSKYKLRTKSGGKLSFTETLSDQPITDLFTGIDMGWVLTIDALTVDGGTISSSGSLAPNDGDPYDVNVTGKYNAGADTSKVKAMWTKTPGLVKVFIKNTTTTEGVPNTITGGTVKYKALGQKGTGTVNAGYIE